MLSEALSIIKNHDFSSIESQINITGSSQPAMITHLELFLSNGLSTHSDRYKAFNRGKIHTNGQTCVTVPAYGYVFFDEQNPIHLGILNELAPDEIQEHARALLNRRWATTLAEYGVLNELPDSTFEDSEWKITEYAIGKSLFPRSEGENESTVASTFLPALSATTFTPFSINGQYILLPQSMTSLMRTIIKNQGYAEPNLLKLEVPTLVDESSYLTQSTEATNKLCALANITSEYRHLLHSTQGEPGVILGGNKKYRSEYILRVVDSIFEKDKYEDIHSAHINGVTWQLIPGKYFENDHVVYRPRVYKEQKDVLILSYLDHTLQKKRFAIETSHSLSNILKEFIELETNTLSFKRLVRAIDTASPHKSLRITYEYLVRFLAEVGVDLIQPTWDVERVYEKRLKNIELPAIDSSVLLDELLTLQKEQTNALYEEQELIKKIKLRAIENLVESYFPYLNGASVMMKFDLISTLKQAANRHNTHSSGIDLLLQCLDQYRD